MRAWREECAVFGIWNHPEASRLAYLGLYAMQHRGQESAGIVSLDQGQHIHHKGLGLVGDVFRDADLERLRGEAAVGHVRYSTTGQNLLTNAQPLTAMLLNGPIAVAHNGNIVNSEVLRRELKAQGSIFHCTSDTEIILHLLSKHPSNDLIRALKDSVKTLEGAFSLAVMSHDKLVAVRDPYGFRPLVLGRKQRDDGGWARVVASETCAFDLIGAEFEREIAPGEIFWIDENGEHSERFAELNRSAHCVFEHIYFARPDSVVFGRSVYGSRKNFGRELARENPVEADLVVPVPDSGVAAALGYSSESGIPFELGIIRNHYVGRTFIQPQQSIRDFGVKIKLNPQSAVIKGKRVIVIDDSLVRGTTSRKIVNLIRQAGAAEVHLRIACPPTTGPCYYGVDTPKKSQLIAAQHSQEEIRSFVGADSLAYLSIEGLFKATQGGHNQFCAACFDGEYPTPLFGLDA
ncbi:MAG: amidophosphoribosyltransferase [Bdellovibrionaceae bacterium]|nr:amidophosphoribosyltransferase [Pseudobdellovibrionaceae bacterium]MBX3034266.1 amidophosphoribosyltransferase [Pseudobdellovibrionaceae bacterium]